MINTEDESSCTSLRVVADDGKPNLGSFRNRYFVENLARFRYDGLEQRNDIVFRGFAHHPECYRVQSESFLPVVQSEHNTRTPSRKLTFMTAIV